MGLAEAAGEVHLHRMEVPQQEHAAAEQDDVPGGSTAVQHRHRHAEVGRLLHQLGAGRSSVLEQRIAEDAAGRQEEGQDPSRSAHPFASRNSHRRLEARRLHPRRSHDEVHLGDSFVLHHPRHVVERCGAENLSR